MTDIATDAEPMIDKSTVLAALLEKARQLGHREADAAVEELIAELELRPAPPEPEKVVRVVVEFAPAVYDRIAGSLPGVVTSYDGTLVSAEEIEV